MSSLQRWPTNGGHSAENLPNVQLVKNGCLARCVQSKHDNLHGRQRCALNQIILECCAAAELCSALAVQPPTLISRLPNSLSKAFLNEFPMFPQCEQPARDKSPVAHSIQLELCT